MAGENKEYMDQLHAYALGCLDKEEIVKLRSYIHSGEKYNWQELGEYQNLAALLPSILNIENPEPQLKDKVARKLYRIRDEIRAKRSSDLSGLRISTPQTSAGMDKTPQQEKLEFEEIAEQPPTREAEEDTNLSFPEMRGNLAAKTEEFEVVTSSRKTSEFFRPLRETPVKETKEKPVLKKPVKEEAAPGTEKPAFELHEKEEDIEFYSEPAPEKMKPAEEKQESPWIDYHEEFPPSARREYMHSAETPKSSKFPAILIIILLVVIAAGVYGYLNISSEVNTYKDEIESLNRQISNLSSSTATASEVAEMQRLLGLQETQIISMTGAENNSYGKIIINLNEGKGFLTLGRVVPLNDGQAYQLWISTSARNFVSLGLFRNLNENKYYVFDLPEIQDQNNVRILLTIEPSAGSQQPGSNIHLGATL